MAPLPQTRRAVLALGSNQKPREAFLDLALTEFQDRGIALLVAGPRWNTAPVDAPPQPDFLNQVVLVRGSRSGLGWLELAQAAEARAGRRRGIAQGPRTLDVDVILIEGEHWDTPQLRVPHHALMTRPYLLRGTALVAPEWVPPGQELTILALALQRLGGNWALRDQRPSHPIDAVDDRPSAV
ncbi:MAG: 2-amino-4-hydroxy-6-hydroxymethyldihydropteridine diphosphokinase [Candidatus Dormiibacterota bacterium]